ncbi:MAG: IS1595 family transposase [Dehalococcoidia bacterium]|nr:IS1595 family transposase [Dehalococcoidia bacterium]MDD5494163.1 IS1595 family transposase [Dehalococcoidia bacterium]
MKQKSKQQKFTSKDFGKYFPNDEACLEWIKNHRYPNGILCVSCKKITKHHKIAKRPVYECDRCGHQVSPLAGTIFHKTTTPLTIWFDAIHEIATTRTGFSAKALQRKHGVTYKTAWRMFNQIRRLLTDNADIFTGEVEVDETYIGGHRKHCKTGRGAPGKTAVVGIAQRQGKIVSNVVTDVSRYTVMPLIKKNVAKHTMIYTDEFVTYFTLDKYGYGHEQCNHAKEEWINGNCHTNNIEGFWSLVKRGISGCYHAVSPKYLQLYLNEYQFRYNHRLEETPMFLTVLNQI